MSEKKKPEVFESEVRAVWGDEVELLTPYSRCADKVLVRFKKCGHECWKQPNKLLAGQGCGVPECHYSLISKSKTRSSEQYLADLEKKGYHYELLSEFVGVAHPITVKNLKCGHIYTADAGNILQGSGCPVCHGIKDTAKFSKIIEEKYQGEFTVLGEYVNNRTKILVRHNKCGHEWKVCPKTILNHHVCPHCNKSNGERTIEAFLKKHNLKYKAQYKFPDCKDKKPLPFDFAVFINDEIRLIEYDGEQHLTPKNNGWNNVTNLAQVQRHDYIKDVYCEEHNIPLLRIPFWRHFRTYELLADFLGIKL